VDITACRRRKGDKKRKRVKIPEVVAEVALVAAEVALVVDEVALAAAEVALVVDEALTEAACPTGTGTAERKSGRQYPRYRNGCG
jgi:hypothetical protein